MKRPLFLFGLLGLVGCFLPLIAGMSWFNMRHYDQSWTVWLVMAAFALPTYLGAVAEDSDRGAAIAAAAGFGYLGYKFNTGVFDLAFHGSIGGIMMAVAIVGGIFVSLLGLIASKK